MRGLQSVPNIGGVTAANPDGKIIDEADPIPGTGVTEILYNDIIQMIHKLKRLSGITENGQPDDETNGFQMLTALLAQSLPQWYPETDNVDFSKTKFVIYNNGIYYHKTTLSTNNNPSVDTANWHQVFYWNGAKMIFTDLEGDTGWVEASLLDGGTNLTGSEYLIFRRVGNTVHYQLRYRFNNATGGGIVWELPTEMIPSIPTIGLSSFHTNYPLSQSAARPNIYDRMFASFRATNATYGPSVSINATTLSGYSFGNTFTGESFYLSGSYQI